MKKIVYLILFLLTAFQLVNAQGVLTVSGTVRDSLMGGNLVANQLMELNVLDTNTSTILFTATMLTDTAGQYSFSTFLSSIPNYCSGEIHTYDCNGTMIALHFSVPQGGANYPNFDFYTCPSVASCQTSFVGATTSGNTFVQFTSYPTLSYGTVTQWNWTFGDGTTSTLQNPTHTYSNTSPYGVCLDIYTSTGCSATHCDTVNVGTGPGNCTANLTYGVMTTGAVGFTASSTGSGNVASYLYDFGDGNTLQTNSSAVSHGYASGGTYNACVTVYFTSGCTATACATANVCQAHYSAIPDTSGQFSIILINNSLGGNLDYLWSFGDGGTSTQAYPMHTYAGPGTYTICLTVADTSVNCTSTFCDSIVVINKVNTPFTINVVAAGATAIVPQHPYLQGWSLSPNPANTQLMIDLQLAKESALQVDIIDLHGRVVKTENLSRMSPGKYQQKMEIGSLVDGIYLVRLTDGSKAEVKRLMVAH